MSTAIPFSPTPLDLADVHYLHGPDSTPADGVPRGTVTELELHRGEGSVYPGTSHRVWVYVPAQYDATQPASLVVFLDGAGFLDPQDDMRAAVVLDNLVHRGELPATIGVFVDPGVRDDGNDPDGPRSGRQRNIEYDASDDRYAAFLLEEVLPEVRDRWSITHDHDRWGICGFSSGGNGAFTAAWLRPDAFRRVVCLLPSFAQMPGGNPYPALIPRTPRKPLHVFLLAAHRDLGWDEPEDNWLAHTLRVGAALAEAAYDVRIVLGDGGHDSNHAGVLLPDALRWVLEVPQRGRR